jgi:hypothetical protein
MKRLALFVIFPLIVAVSLGVTCCGNDDGGCKDPTPMLCNDGECHACCDDDDCLDNQDMADCLEENIICNNTYKCECDCLQDGEDCSRDPGACCGGLACDIFTNTCMTECTGDADCASRDIPFAGDLKCKNGACDFDHCNKDADCAVGKVCFNGDCVTIPDCSDLKECLVLPVSVVTKQGTTAQFAATPYLSSGAVAPGFVFSWASSVGAVAAVDADGLVTGGIDTGSATITATVDGCPNTSCTAEVGNYGPPTGGHSRVVVVDELENTPIVGATVVIGAETPVTTVALGVAEVAVVLDSDSPQDITVSKQDFNYVTMRAVESNDVIVHMGKLHHLDFSEQPPVRVAGGIKGKFDFSMIRCEPPLKTCDVSLGLGGLSIPGNLVNLNLDMLIGGMIKTQIDMGANPMEISLPSSLVLCINQTCFKEHFTPTGIVPKNRVAWGLGGKLDLVDLTEMFGSGDIDINSLVVGLLPLFANFHTAMVPNVDVVPRPMVDDVDDIDGDENTTEVPDYDNFLPQDLALKVGMDHTMTFKPPALPVGTYDSVILIGGIIVRGAGLVPLGLSSGMDSLDDEDVPDGVIDDPIVINVADVAGRIPEDQVKRVVIALAMNNEAGLTGSTDIPMALAGQVMYVDSFSGTHTLPAFMTPAKATYAEDSGLLKVIDAGAGADYTQATFTSAADDKNWNVLGVFENGDYILPTDPDPQDPRNHGVNFINIDIKDAGNYQSLVEFNDDNMDNLVESVTSFCFLEVPECYVNDDCVAPEICDGTRCESFCKSRSCAEVERRRGSLRRASTSVLRRGVAKRGGGSGFGSEWWTTRVLPATLFAPVWNVRIEPSLRSSPRLPSIRWPTRPPWL